MLCDDSLPAGYHLYYKIYCVKVVFILCNIALPGRPVHSDTNSASPGIILARQQLRATTKSLCMLIQKFPNYLSPLTPNFSDDRQLRLTISQCA